MTAFTSFLLEQGIEIELPISLNESLGMIEEIVAAFSHEGHGYLLAAVSRGQLGSRWELAVKVTDPMSNRPIADEPVGFVNLTRVAPDATQLVVPPRTPEGGIEADHFDAEGRYFGAFIFQMMNALTERNLMEMPGVLPRFS